MVMHSFFLLIFNGTTQNYLISNVQPILKADVLRSPETLVHVEFKFHSSPVDAICGSGGHCFLHLTLDGLELHQRDSNLSPPQYRTDDFHFHKPRLERNP